jgi:hypothetical protein
MFPNYLYLEDKSLLLSWRFFYLEVACVLTPQVEFVFAAYI